MILMGSQAWEPLVYRNQGRAAKVVKVPYRWVTKAQERKTLGFPGGAVVKNPPANAGDMGSSPGLGRSHMPRSN